MRGALLGFVFVAGCGPVVHVKAIGSRVDPLPAPTAVPAAGAEAALPAQIPGGWRLSGGPADYTAASAGEALGEETGRFRGLKSYGAAEYANGGQRVIALEVFALSSLDAAAGAMKVGRPADAKPISGDDLDEAFRSGLRAEVRKGSVLVRVRWFEDKDESLADGAIAAARDVLAAALKAGLSSSPAAGSPGASPTPSPLPSGTPLAAPTR